MKNYESYRSNGRRRQKKKKKIALISTICLLTGLFVICSIFCFFRYNNGKLEGVWRNNQSEQALQEYTLGILQETLPEADHRFFTVEHQLHVKENLAQLTAKASFDIPRLADLTLDYAYSEMLKEAENEAASQGIALEDYLLSAVGPNYEQSLKSLLPSKENLEEQFHKQQENLASEIGGSYDKSKGTMTLVYFKGQVEPLLNTIAVKSSNETITSILHDKKLNVGERFTYHRQGNTLILDYNQSKFTLEK